MHKRKFCYLKLNAHTCCSLKMIKISRPGTQASGSGFISILFIISRQNILTQVLLCHGHNASFYVICRIRKKLYCYWAGRKLFCYFVHIKSPLAPYSFSIFGHIYVVSKAMACHFLVIDLLQCIHIWHNQIKEYSYTTLCLAPYTLRN